MILTHMCTHNSLPDVLTISLPASHNDQGYASEEPLPASGGWDRRAEEARALYIYMSMLSSIFYFAQQAFIPPRLYA